MPRIATSMLKRHAALGVEGIAMISRASPAPHIIEKRSDMDDFIKAAEDLRTKMWRTSGSRYLAANRLSRRDRYSTFSVSILSVVAIGVGLLNPAISGGASHAGFTTVSVTAIISVFILAISLIEGSAKTAVQASKLHENAVIISEIRTSLESMLAKARASGAADWQQLNELRKEYEARIRECPYNHETIDYQRFEDNHRTSPEFLSESKVPRMGWIRCQWVKVRHLTDAAWLSFVSWIVVFGLIVLVIDWGYSEGSLLRDHGYSKMGHEQSN
jgi:hypothetical protein